jgi:hypothetical protein
MNADEVVECLDEIESLIAGEYCSHDGPHGEHKKCYAEPVYKLRRLLSGVLVPQKFQQVNHTLAPCCACHGCWHKHGEGYHSYCEYHSKETWEDAKSNPKPLEEKERVISITDKCRELIASESKPKRPVSVGDWVTVIDGFGRTHQGWIQDSTKTPNPS